MGSNSEKFGNLAFLDLETTGLEPTRYDRASDVFVPHNEIVEYGLVLADMQTLEVVDTYEQKVIPSRPTLMSDRAREINGYDPKVWSREGTDLVTATARLLETIEEAGGAVLLGGNIVFDWSFLYDACQRSGFDKTAIDEVIYYSKREVTSFALGRLLGVGEIELGSFSSRWAEAKLGMEDEPLPHRALNGAMWMYERFKRAYFKTYQDRFNYPI